MAPGGVSDGVGTVNRVVDGGTLLDVVVRRTVVDGRGCVVDTTPPGRSVVGVGGSVEGIVGGGDVLGGSSCACATDARSTSARTTSAIAATARITRPVCRPRIEM